MIPYRTRHMNSKPRYLRKSRMPCVFWLPWSLQVFRSLIVIKYSKNSAPATILTARHMLLVSLDAWHVEITLLISSASWYLKYLATALRQHWICSMSHNWQYHGYHTAYGFAQRWWTWHGTFLPVGLQKNVASAPNAFRYSLLSNLLPFEFQSISRTPQIWIGLHLCASRAPMEGLLPSFFLLWIQILCHCS